MCTWSSMLATIRPNVFCGTSKPGVREGCARQASSRRTFIRGHDMEAQDTCGTKLSSPPLSRMSSNVKTLKNNPCSTDFEMKRGSSLTLTASPRAYALRLRTCRILVDASAQADSQAQRTARINNNPVRRTPGSTDRYSGQVQRTCLAGRYSGQDQRAGSEPQRVSVRRDAARIDPVPRTIKPESRTLHSISKPVVSSIRRRRRRRAARGWGEWMTSDSRRPLAVFGAL